MLRAAGVLAAIAAAAPAAAQRPFSVQDLLTAVRVSDPQVSPGGA